MGYEYVPIIETNAQALHRHGFDLRYKICWNHEMYAWCEDQFGPPYHEKDNPSAIWSRAYSNDYALFMRVRFARFEHAIAFKFRFL